MRASGLALLPWTMSSSLGADLSVLWHMRRLLAVLTRRELSARFAGSAGGVLWVWLPPVLTMAAYFLVFDLVFGMRLSSGAPTARVGTFLIVGMLAWMAFADAAQRGMSSLIDAGGLLQKNPLPAVLFPARAVLASTVVFAPLILLLILLYAPAHRFHLAVIAVPALILLQTLLSFLVSYLLAILAAALRDVVQVVGVLLSLGIFLSPVLFPMSMFPSNWRWLLWFNPMTAPILGYQAALLQGAWPAPAVWAAIAAWIAGMALVLSVAVARSREHLVDWL